MKNRIVRFLTHHQQRSVTIAIYFRPMLIDRRTTCDQVVCLHLLGMIWTPMVPEEEGLPVPFCVDRRIISLSEPVILSCE
jgi:hypothetical protein